MRLRIALRGSAAAAVLSSLLALAMAALLLSAGDARRSHVAPASYVVRLDGRGFVAVNPRQGLRIGFGPGGAELRAGALHASLGLRAFGYGRARAPVASAVPRASSGRVVYAHAGISEWYANRPAGLEQGFTVARAPSQRAVGPLTLAIALSGTAHASLSAAGQSIELATARGQSLRYGALHASDASGRVLPSWFALTRGEILIELQARGARYPLRIDPLIQQGEPMTDGKATSIGFGTSVALAEKGNIALVGAPRKSGAAWAMTRTGSTWQLGQMLSGPSERISELSESCEGEPGGEVGETRGCGFGDSVALSADGKTALIGSPREVRPCASGPECTFQGAAWVFTREGETWALQAVLLGGGEETAGGRFGRGVALSSDGSTALIGAPADGGTSGAAWVFTRTGKTWSQQGAKLTASEETGASHLGYSVALSADGNAALIGAPGDASYTGAAWVFTRSGTSWTQAQKLLASGEIGAGHFGSGVALSANAEYALIGGFGDNVSKGAVWSFTRAGGALAPREKLTGRGEKGRGLFGYSVALSGKGNLALAGGPQDSDIVGTVWAFTRASGGWNPFSQKLKGSLTTADKNEFGHSVALSGDGSTALVGGPRDNSATIGAVWPYAHGEEVELPTEEEEKTIEKEEILRTPRVTSVEPRQGSAAGGTAVTIEGTELEGVTRVLFGTTEAARFENSAAEPKRVITAISPPHAAGPVDVVVYAMRTPSPTSAKDRFTFIAQPGAAPGGAPTGITASSGGGVLSFGPTASCRPSLLSRNITVSSKGRTRLKLKLSGSGACRGKLTLSVKIKRPHVRAKVRTIATGGFSSFAGRTTVFALTLNKLGRKLLHDAHGRLGASLAIVRLTPAPVQARTASVRLTLQRPHGAPPKKH